MRRGANGEELIVTCNFTPVSRNHVRIGVPSAGEYIELINSDSEYYGGTNVGNASAVTANATPHQGQAFSIEVTLPPLGLIVFKKNRSTPATLLASQSATSTSLAKPIDLKKN
jgi:1,4-alpha-glucan branching enzyme